jgi:hypothetical protein
VISRGVISVCEAFRDPTLRAAARAFARGLNGELLLAIALVGYVGEGSAEPAAEPLLSEATESVLGPRGTVSVLRFWEEVAGESGDCGRIVKSGGGFSSAAGMGNPRAAATS